MTVLQTGEVFEPEVGWLGMGILLCDVCGQRVETLWELIIESLMWGEWTSYRQQNEDGGTAEVHVCPKCQGEQA